MKRWTLVIGGRSVETARHNDVINPSTGEPVGAMPMAGAEELNAAVDAAADAFTGWSQTSDAARAEACLAIAGQIEAHSEELAHLLTLEQGKPLNGLGSRFEIGGAVAWTRYTAGLALPIEVIQDRSRRPCRIAPQADRRGGLDHALELAGDDRVLAYHPGDPDRQHGRHQTFAADAPEHDPARGDHQRSLPPGVVNVVTGDNEIGAQMSRHSGIGKVTFTGSTATGRKIMESAAGTLKRLTLELGGNDAGIVLPGSDPKAIAEGLFWGAFINGGQTCAALKRLYVHDSLYDDVCTALTDYARNVVVGDGLDETSALGPVQNRRQFDIVSAYVEEARAKGGRVLIGGEPGRGPGLFLSGHAGRRRRPRLPSRRRGAVRSGAADHPLPRSRRSRSKANASPMGLGGSVWARDRGRPRRSPAVSSAGSVWINKHGAIQPNAPFGGVKQSGVGVEFGIDGLKEFTTIQTVFC